MSQTERELLGKMNEEQVLLAKVALVAVSEVPIAGGIISGLASIALDGLEPEPMNEDTVNRLINKKEVQNLKDKNIRDVAWIGQLLNNIKLYQEKKKKTIQEKRTLEEKLIQFEEETYKRCWFCMYSKNKKYDNAKTFYKLPFFAIYANYHLVALKMRGKQGEFNEKIKEYTKYLYDAFFKSIKWRHTQVNAIVDPDNWFHGLRDWQIKTKDDVDPNRNFEIEINRNDSKRIESSRSDDEFKKAKNGYNKIAKDIKSQLCRATLTQFYFMTNIESVLDQWVKKCPDTFLKPIWKRNVREWSFLKPGYRIVTIKAMWGKSAGKYLSHNEMDVRLKGGKFGRDEVFLIQPIGNGRCVIRTFGKNMGGYLSYGHGNVSVKFHHLPGEEWKMIDVDFSTPNYEGFKHIVGKSPNVTGIICPNHQDRDSLAHRGGGLQIANSERDITCLYWKVEDVDPSWSWKM